MAKYHIHWYGDEIVYDIESEVPKNDKSTIDLDDDDLRFIDKVNSEYGVIQDMLRAFEHDEIDKEDFKVNFKKLVQERAKLG